MKEKFNLSNKIRGNAYGNPSHLLLKDVKEFIMNIKSEISTKFMGSDEYHLHKIIDEFAGDKLI